MNEWLAIHDGELVSALINLDHVISIRVREKERPSDAPSRYEVVAFLAGGGTVQLYESSLGDCQQQMEWLIRQLGGCRHELRDPHRPPHQGS